MKTNLKKYIIIMKMKIIRTPERWSRKIQKQVPPERRKRGRPRRGWIDVMPCVQLELNGSWEQNNGTNYQNLYNNNKCIKNKKTKSLGQKK